MGETSRQDKDESDLVQPELESKVLERQRLYDEVEGAIKNAPAEQEFLERQKAITKIMRKHMSGEDVSEEEQKSLENTLGQVVFSDFESLENVLCDGFGFDEDAFKKFAEHEKDHFETAQREKLDPQILIKFFKLADGSIKFVPSVRMRFKKDKEGLANSMKKVMKAPIRLSKSDKEKIE